MHMRIENVVLIIVWLAFLHFLVYFFPSNSTTKMLQVFPIATLLFSRLLVEQQEENSTVAGNV